MSLYYLNVTVHLLAALLWLGGMFFLGAVGAPVLRAVEPQSLRAELFTRLGERARVVGWWAIGVLVVTGVLNLHFRGLLVREVWLDSGFWGTRYGVALAWKLAAVTTMIAISALHDFVFGPRAGRMNPGSAAAAEMRKRAAWLARVNAVVGVVLVIAAVRLARGG
jgi:copper resistance protein D